ncbi:MAG TPA: hypothetical protein VFI65_24185 [Streptosporangiaceae bacterium]|nr:hypothetical protein [Streptosporangiaceae bacterium]
MEQTGDELAHLERLAAEVDLLGAGGYGFSVPAWDGRAYLKVTSGRRVAADLTITGSGDVFWEYRFVQCPYLDPGRLVGIAVDLLGQDCARPVLGPYPLIDTPMYDVARYGLLRHGFTVNVTETAEAGQIFAVTNPVRPYRGTVRVTGDGELLWSTRAPHHRDGGLPLPDIAATISRALARVGHSR